MVLDLNKMVSVVIPIYNAEKYLEQCIESVLSQTYNNIEVICVDDGSTDNSLLICNKYAQYDKRIKVIHKFNEGVTSARKTGVNSASGKWIMFVDSDDWIDAEMCQVLVEKALLYDTPLVSVRYRRCYENYFIENQMGFKEGLYEDTRFENEIIPNFIFSKKIRDYGVDASMDTKLFEKEKLYEVISRLDDDIIFHEDGAIVYSYILQNKKIYICNKAMYNYRMSDYSSSIHSFDDVKYDSYKKAKKFIKEYANRYSYKDIIYEQLDMCELKHILMFMPDMIPIYDKDKILYPFGDIYKTDKIVLYGAGTMGMKYYQYLINKGIDVCLWIDKRWNEIDTEYKISSIEDINSVDYDKILVAVGKADIIRNIKEELLLRNIEEDKICCLDFKKMENMRKSLIV
jgi:glycosyltransferase involved in cell wall biosynthesis